MVGPFVSPTDEGSFTTLITNIDEGIEEARVGLGDCSDTYNAKKDDISLWDKFLDWFTSSMQEVVDKLNEAIKQFQEFMATIADYLSPGNPFAMNFLADYAKKILDSWIDFGARLITYLIDQVDAAAAFITADPLEWLDAVPKIVTVCTNLAQLAVDLGEQLGKNFTASQEVADKLRQDMANLTGFPSGAWPTATI